MEPSSATFRALALVLGGRLFGVPRMRCTIRYVQSAAAAKHCWQGCEPEHLDLWHLQRSQALDTRVRRCAPPGRTPVGELRLPLLALLPTLYYNFKRE